MDRSYLAILFSAFDFFQVVALIRDAVVILVGGALVAILKKQNDLKQGGWRRRLELIAIVGAPSLTGVVKGGDFFPACPA